MGNILQDRQFETCTIISVSREKDGWMVEFDHASLFVPNKKCITPPVSGERAQLYGKGFGYTVRGIVIGGRIYRYLTQEESDAEHKATVEQSKRDRRAKFETTRSQFEADVAALPEPFRKRFEWFSQQPDWLPDNGPYELFVCKEAVKFADRLKTVDAIRAFAQNTASVPDLADEDHSGNTFGVACRLAACYLQEPDLIPKMHGALCALVGCKGYGCWAASQVGS